MGRSIASIGRDFALLTQLQLELARVDVVIDLGAIGGEDAQAAVLVARGALQALPEVHRWRSVTVAGSSFPATVGEAVGRNHTVVARRAERELYRFLLEGIKQLSRLQRLATMASKGRPAK